MMINSFDHLDKFLDILPWDCVIAGIDPGKKERGITIFIQGEEDSWGNTYDYIEVAYLRAKYYNLPLVFVMETHTRHGKWGTKQYRGIAEDVGVWKHYIKLVGEKHKDKKGHLKMVKVNDWRKGVFGYFKRPAFSSKNYWKVKAVEETGIADHNIAESFLIGLYGTRWDVIGKIRGIEKYDPAMYPEKYETVNNFEEYVYAQ